MGGHVPKIGKPETAPSTRLDADLIAWDREMEILIVACRNAEDAALAAEEEWRAKGLPRGSDAYWDFIRPTHDAATDASNAVDAVATLIRSREAATPAGLVVKAKALRWDASLYGDDNAPVEEWDWDKECVHLFIAELKRFAAANHMG
jgi:hypothetical protein